MKEAERSAAPPAVAKAFSLIGDAKLKRLYAAMVQCRMLDDRIRQIHRQSKTRYTSSAGHEAAIVGAAIDLRREDWLVPRQWESAASWIKGVPLATIFAGPDSTGLDPLPSISEPAGKRANPQKIVPPISSLAVQLDIAAGIAMAAKAANKGVVMAFCESIATSSAQLLPTLRFIAEHRLPLLVVMQSGSPGKRRPAGRKDDARSVAGHASAFGIPIIPVDRADVVAMYRVAFESIHKARHNGGPTIIEAAAWRPPAGNHVKEKELPTDPIARMEAYLTGKGLFSDRWNEGLAGRFAREIEASESEARSKDR
jgi:TPP-dependent pyruvate/acetoin dehydrogenase alpha subunit